MWPSAGGWPVRFGAGLGVRQAVEEEVVPLASCSLTTGALVSRVKVSEDEPVRPAELVSLATTACVPSASVGVYDQTPLELAVVVAAMALPSTVKCTGAPASAVPVSAGLEV